MLTVKDLIEQPALIRGARTITWGIRPALAQFLDEAVGPGSVTLETGAGLSTLVILRRQPPQHTAVQPVADEFAVIGDKVPRGAEHEGIRNEDLTALTFPDEGFDLILSFDVMEHVPDSDAALRECFRCLRPGGILLFGAPFRLGSPQNVERARMRSDETIEDFMPPEYHWQPLTSENGALAFRDFGWQVLQQMRDAGFADPRALLYWSLELGYLGGDQVLLVASRPGHGEAGR